MKLCKKCYDCIREAGYQIDCSQYMITLLPYLVSENDFFCEFWAHKKLNELDQLAKQGMQAGEVAPEDIFIITRGSPYIDGQVIEKKK